MLAFADFEKKGKKDTCPPLEQFLCHIAKTGQPMWVPWVHVKNDGYTHFQILHNCT